MVSFPHPFSYKFLNATLPQPPVIVCTLTRFRHVLVCQIIAIVILGSDLNQFQGRSDMGREGGRDRLESGRGEKEEGVKRVVYIYNIELV